MLIILNFIILAIIVSCSLTPEYRRPGIPVDSEFNSQSASATTKKSNEGQLAWDNYFSDPDLHSLIELSLKNNRDLRQASLHVEAARALFGIQKADQLPSVGVGASLYRAHLPDSVGPLMGGNNPLTFYSVTLGVSSWELDFWGRVRSLKEAALESYFSSIEAQSAARLILITQVSQSYLYQRELEERLQIAEETLKLREKSLEIAKKRFVVGSGFQLQINQAEILYNQAASERVELERLKAQNINALTLLAGAKLPELISRPLSSVEQHFLKELPVGVPSDLLLNRPDILMAEHQLKSANANIGAARAAFFPSISLTGILGQGSIELNQLFDGGNQVWAFGPSVNIPIFNAGKLKSNLELTKVREKTAIAQYELAIQKAFREVSDVLAERRWVKEQLKIQEDTLRAQTERSSITKKRYDQGSASYLEVLDSERERFVVEQGVVQMRRTFLATNINLFAALGGSFIEIKNK